MKASDFQVGEMIKVLTDTYNGHAIIPVDMVGKIYEIAKIRGHLIEVVGSNWSVIPEIIEKVAKDELLYSFEIGDEVEIIEHRMAAVTGFYTICDSKWLGKIGKVFRITQNEYHYHPIALRVEIEGNNVTVFPPMVKKVSTSAPVKEIVCVCPPYMLWAGCPRMKNPSASCHK